MVALNVEQFDGVLLSEAAHGVEGGDEAPAVDEVGVEGEDLEPRHPVEVPAVKDLEHAVGEVEPLEGSREGVEVGHLYDGRPAEVQCFDVPRVVELGDGRHVGSGAHDFLLLPLHVVASVRKEAVEEHVFRFVIAAEACFHRLRKFFERIWEDYLRWRRPELAPVLRM